MTTRLTGAAGWLRPLAAPVALLLLALASTSPIWLSRLSAPQYPKGLWLVVFGGRITGDVREINGLNHYIGMRTFGQDTVPELGLWWLAIVSAAVLVLAGLFLRGKLGLLARVGLWAMPLVVIADIQRWLITFGRDLDPTAALRLEPFVPLAIGPTQVWNFKILALPGPGLILLLVVALLVTLAHRLSGPPSRRSVLLAAAGAAALALVLAGGAVTTSALATAETTATVRADAPAAFDLTAAIAAAPAGAELHVAAGRYPGPITLARPIALIGHGDAVLDGGGTGTVLTIAAPGVTVRGLRIERSGGQVEDASGIAVLADGARIEDNVLRDVYVGVLARGTRGLRIVGNTISGPGGAGMVVSLDASHHPGARTAVGDGIWLHDTEGSLVRGNEISGMRDGLYLSYARETLVDTNHIHDLRYALHAMFGSDLMVFENTIERNASGLVLMNTAAVEASRNVITDHRSDATGYGILLKDVRSVRVVENTIARDQIGIRVEGVDRTQALADVLLNDIAHNVVGVQLFPTAQLVFSRNSFTGNVVNVDTPGAARSNGSEWTKSGAGNYWSGYAGYDLDGDRLGDVAHVEGSSAERLVTAAPELRILRTSVAFSILARAERWWNVGQAPRILDRIPLVAPLAPAPAAPSRSVADSAAWVVTGLALLAALGALGHLRRAT